MGNSILKNWISKNAVIVTLTLFMSDVFASTTGNDVPFAGAMNKLKDAIAGPFLFAVTIIMIITTCFMLAFGEWGQGFMKVITLVFYLSIAFGAVQFVTWLYGSGAVF